MNQVVDRRKTRTCAKWTLGVLRTGTLLAGAAFASMLMVDPPSPAGCAAADSRGVVRASDKWIELGVPQHPAVSSPEARQLEADLRAAQGGGLRPSS